MPRESSITPERRALTAREIEAVDLGKKIACHPKFKPRNGALYLGVGYGLRFSKRWDPDAQPFDTITMVRLEDAATVGTVIDTLKEAPGVVAFVVNWSTYPKPGHWTVEAFREAGGEASGNGECLGVAAAKALLQAWEVTP